MIFVHIGAGAGDLDPAPGWIWGDGNDDGEFSVGDVLFIQQIVVDPPVIVPNATQLAQSDIFPDGSLEVNDAFFASRVLARLAHFTEATVTPGIELDGTYVLEALVVDRNQQPVDAGVGLSFEVGLVANLASAICAPSCEPTVSGLLVQSTSIGDGRYVATLSGLTVPEATVGVVVVVDVLDPEGGLVNRTPFLESPLQDPAASFKPLVSFNISETCPEGEECCVVDDDCSASSTPPACDDAATCQGSGMEIQCLESICTEVVSEDDSACGAEVIALDCAPFASVHCTGEVDQTPPALTCPTACVDHGDCGSDLACVNDGCEPVLCSLSGDAGATVDCPLLLVRGQESDPVATQLQMTLDFDGSLAALASLEVCGALEEPFHEIVCSPGGGECDGLGDPTVSCNEGTGFCWRCSDFAADDTDAKLTSGHSIQTCAQPPANCGANDFFLLFWTSESTPLSMAYLDAGAINGGAELAVLRFSLLQNVPEAIPVSISPAEFLATDGFAAALPVTVQTVLTPTAQRVLVTGAP